jgi:hypothetical protein
MKRPQDRMVRVGLAVCGVLAGFAITAGILVVVRGGLPAAHVTGQGAARAGSSAGADVIRGGGDSELSPAALDKQWPAYSDHSGCADWAGGDGVSAIKLNSSQIAWFFADTYLGPAGPTTGFTHVSGFLHNSVVIQTRTGNRTRLVTLTGGGGCASGNDADPAASVVSAPARVRQRYWDADGIRVGGAVVKFYNSYLLGRVPYVPTGTTIASFPVSKLSAAGRADDDGGVIKPKLTPIPTYTPADGGTPVVWGSALLKSGPTVYIYGWQSASASSSQRLLYLARVRASRITDFAAWRFYAGGRWSASQSLAVPVESTAQNFAVATGFSVVRIAGRYWLIQTMGAGDPDIYAYPAPNPWGPYDAQGILLYHAPGIGLDAANDYRIMYEARAEPALSTSKSLVISYNVNSEAVTGACVSIGSFTNAFIQPRFISVPQSAFATSASTVQELVRSAGPAYPQVMQDHRGQWFDSLLFPDGCPPVPGVSRVAANAGLHLVRLTWPSAGIGMRYRVYVSSGSEGLRYVRTVSSHRATVTGLTSRLTYTFEIVPENIHSDTGPAAYTSAQLP